MEIGWLTFCAVNTMAAVWLSQLLLFDYTYYGISRLTRHRAPGCLVLLLLTAFLGMAHALLVIGIAWAVSLPIAGLVSAALFANWGMASYYLLQRFESPAEKIGLVRSHPQILHFVSLAACFSLSCVAFILFGWLGIFAAFASWLLHGYACTELAIFRRKLLSHCDRDTAVYRINMDQGRGLLWSELHGGRKYPFP
jgi:hypothetical protein